MSTTESARAGMVSAVPGSGMPWRLESASCAVIAREQHALAPL